MRRCSAAGLLGFMVFVTPALAQTKGAARLNPLVALHEQGLPVFGIVHPAIEPGRARAGEPAPALPSIAVAARETVAYRGGDYEYNSFGGGASGERFLAY